eukprot:2204492-Pyramimonas_sp.AAC.1
MHCWPRRCNKRRPCGNQALIWSSTRYLRKAGGAKGPDGTAPMERCMRGQAHCARQAGSRMTRCNNLSEHNKPNAADTQGQSGRRLYSERASKAPPSSDEERAAPESHKA